MDKKARLPFPAERLNRIVKRTKEKALTIKSVASGLEFAPPLLLQKEKIDQGMKVLEACMVEEEKEMGISPSDFKKETWKMTKLLRTFLAIALLAGFASACAEYRFKTYDVKCPRCNTTFSIEEERQLKSLGFGTP